MEKDKGERLSTDNKVRCCYFDEGNLQAIDVKDLRIITGPLRLINIYQVLCKQAFEG